MLAALRGLVADERGSVLVETALLLVLVSIAGYAAYQTFGRLVGHQAENAAMALGHG
jgi:Flp pilus assembly pilin Flp